ncbi:MAG: acid phosphatase, partial [Elusimicrobia bacterium]|nr:acid phosphatase [Elusimicrobiota bacterium]
PFLTRLAKDGALLRQYYAVAHPSQPNYLALVSGSTHDVFSDDNVTLDGAQLGDLLEKAGKSWRVYAEGYPGGCFLGARRGRYVRKHVPFLSFREVQQDPARCARIVDGARFFSDLAAGSLPDYSLFIPDLDDDGHDTGVSFADRWLAKAFGPLLPHWPADTLLIVTFDEDDYGGDNQVYTALYGSIVRPGAVSLERYNHYSLLRTMEDGLGVGTLGAKDEAASPIAGVWATPSPQPQPGLKTSAR